jgi:hypothetical protein
MGMLTQAHPHPYFGGVVMTIESEQMDGNNMFTPLFDMYTNAVNGSSDNFAICDNGAQICILGGLTGDWHIETVLPHRQVNIVGVVASTMRRNNLPIIMAITKNNDRAVLWSTDKEITTIGALSTLLSDLVSNALVALLCVTFNI